MRTLTILVMDDDNNVLDEVDIHVEDIDLTGKTIPISTQITDLILEEFDIT